MVGHIHVSLEFLEFPPTCTCDGGGESHRYQFRVYGLDTMLSIPPGSTSHELVANMRGHVLQYGETVAMCTR